MCVDVFLLWFCNFFFPDCMKKKPVEYFTIFCNIDVSTDLVESNHCGDACVNPKHALPHTGDYVCTTRVENAGSALSCPGYLCCWIAVCFTFQFCTSIPVHRYMLHLILKLRSVCRIQGILLVYFTLILFILAHLWKAAILPI